MTHNPRARRGCRHTVMTMCVRRYIPRVCPRSITPGKTRCVVPSRHLWVVGRLVMMFPLRGSAYVLPSCRLTHTSQCGSQTNAATTFGCDAVGFVHCGTRACFLETTTTTHPARPWRPHAAKAEPTQGRLQESIALQQQTVFERRHCPLSQRHLNTMSSSMPAAKAPLATVGP